MLLTPGLLLLAPPTQDDDPTFRRTVVLLIDQEPSGITTGLALNRPIEGRSVADESALALLFVPEPHATAFWGGPVGSEPAILAQFRSTDDLDWFHLPIQQRRPFPLSDVGVIAVAEHPGPFEDRILRSRLFVGLCVWGRGQLEAEVERATWLIQTRATPDDVFSAEPDRLWQHLLERTGPA